MFGLFKAVTKDGNKTKTISALGGLLALAAQLGYITPDQFVTWASILSLLTGVTIADSALGYPGRTSQP